MLVRVLASSASRLSIARRLVKLFQALDRNLWFSARTGDSQWELDEVAGDVKVSLVDAEEGLSLEATGGEGSECSSSVDERTSLVDSVEVEEGVGEGRGGKVGGVSPPASGVVCPPPIGGRDAVSPG